jgi:hypothetical protein
MESVPEYNSFSFFSIPKFIENRSPSGITFFEDNEDIEGRILLITTFLFQS